MAVPTRAPRRAGSKGTRVRPLGRGHGSRRTRGTATGPAPGKAAAQPKKHRRQPKSVSDRQLALTAARSARDKTLYQPAKGLVDTAADTKSYIRSVYGNASSEAKHLATLNFRACA
jgi:hypothetical protein